MTSGMMIRSVPRAAALLGLCLAFGAPPRAETGANLWLRYDPLGDRARAEARRHASAIVGVASPSPTVHAAIAELERGLGGLLSARVRIVDRVTADGAVVIAPGARSPLAVSLGWNGTLERLGSDGYVIRAARAEGKAVTVIASAGETGVLYGAFHFLRLLQTGHSVAGVDIAERPRF